MNEATWLGVAARSGVRFRSMLLIKSEIRAVRLALGAFWRLLDALRARRSRSSLRRWSEQQSLNRRHRSPRKMVGRFVTEFLPNRKGPKALNGQGPATIRRKVSLLGQVWVWAQRRGLLPYTKERPWDEQAPSTAERRILAPDEAVRLLNAAPVGQALGDVVRVALLTGVRLEEVASLEAIQVEADARWYAVRKGKSDNAPRIVPLVGVAEEVIKARLAEHKTGPLFPELPLRKSTGRRGGAVSQAFTRLRREVLGEQTDRELTLHCTRHTWRTAARRAGVDLRTAHELGGWTRGNATDSGYGHGLELKHYIEEQKRVAAWLVAKGYFGSAA